MILTIIRTLILFTVVVVALRIMGKRQIGQLQPYELVVIILLSELAAIPMEDSGIPLVSGLLPILTLVVAEVTLSFIALKSLKARNFLGGTPVVVVENGKLMETEMRKARYNINDLLEELRAKDYHNISDIEFAILETSGRLSVIPKSQKRPLMPQDLNIATSYEGMSLPLVIDGELVQKNLQQARLDASWLNNELAKFGVKGYRDVLFASLDTAGNLFCQVKAKAPKTKSTKNESTKT
jgi:uncharacterized membrane protein YcaP (DUF421 family)